MEIRKMRQGEEPSAYSLMCSSLDEYFAPEVVSYFMMQWSSGQIVAVDLFGHIVGYLAGARLPNGRASISLFCVDSNYRGKGVGSMMLNHFRQAAMMEGISSIQLEVKDGNTFAFEFYRKRGFVPTERLEAFYNDGSSGTRMVLDMGFGNRRITYMS
ncbi:MAG: GNAT family N-acetyltransferase [archaeon]|nr:GNAT family N-acetyltransferase [archaeon]